MAQYNNVRIRSFELSKERIEELIEEARNDFENDKSIWPLKYYYQILRIEFY
jgi:hypothetical protein